MTIDKSNLMWAHPLIQDWFITKFGSPTEPQLQGWPAILAGKSTLISAPTGSGKTLAAFLACINHLFEQSVNGELNDETEVLYISPLKALSNDVQKNLMQPLHEISQLAKERSLVLSPIRTAVRTGDTLTRERQAMLKKPPHILITTPESFYILLTAEKSRAMLSKVKTVIIDEIHVMINDKRGAHLSLSLERLEALLPHPLLRIGLSATQKPLDTVGRFLVGSTRQLPSIVNIGHARQLELHVEVPDSELGPVASNEMWEEVYDRLAVLAHENRSTLIFVNTRRLAERVAHHLTERLGEQFVTAHHGSLSRKLRLDAEERLKNGELKVLVATGSLELGIDIGNVDLVCQIGSPRAIAAALQRVGRAGHWHGAISKGRFFALTRDELVECAALVKAIREGDLDKLILIGEPLDILAQQIVAACATQDWSISNLFSLVKQSYPYANLSQETFDSVIEMLSEGITGQRGRYGTYLFYDRLNGKLKGRRQSRLVAITNGGAIPDNALFTVVSQPNNVVVGTLDEDFAIESNRGDIILLGTSSWKIIRIESASSRVWVEDAHGAPPSVPFWQGEASARTDELSVQISYLREKVSELLAEVKLDENNKSHPKFLEAVDWLKAQCHLNNPGAEQLLEYFLQTKAILGTIPTQNTIIAERFFDESGGMQLIIHSPFGARLNKAWGLALRKRFCRSFNFELQAAATDNGINISLSEQHSFPLTDVFHFLHPNSLKEVLIQAVLDSPVFNTRWRWTATRSLSIKRFRNGRKMPPNILRMLSEDLLAAVFPDAAACQDNLGGREIELPDHPLINETMKDVLTQALDMDGLSALLTRIYNNNIVCLGIDTPVPSPFSHEILNANPYAFLDDAPLEERRARAVEMRRILPQAYLEEIGKLDPQAIAEVQQQAWPDIRNEDELQDLLQTLIALPCSAIFNKDYRSIDLWKPFFEKLEKAGRASQASNEQQQFWTSIEKAKTFRYIYPNASIQSQLVELDQKESTEEDAIFTMLKGWMLHLGPITTNELSEILALDSDKIEAALLKLENSGLILRGHFRTATEMEWCERRLLSRIHRLTIGKLRKEIEAVSVAQFMRWLLTWQHLAPGTQLQGEKGLLEVIKQLQGFEISANAWEDHIFKKRLVDYNSMMLDYLCFTGQVGWGRLSIHDASSQGKRVIPRSDTPITFFIREDSDWLPLENQFLEEEHLNGLSTGAQNIYLFLKNNGASFLTDIMRKLGKIQSEIEMGLWELVAAGVITADGFDNLRALIDPKRRLDKRRRKFQLHSGGRWSLLSIEKEIEKSEQVKAVCWMLLNRYGVVFRDLIAREKNVPKWRELLIAFRRLEDRGEIRGGRFVSGFIGEQFALPYAVESLRASKKHVAQMKPFNISPVDPLNLSGVILPGKKISNLSSALILLKDGIPAEE